MEITASNLKVEREIFKRNASPFYSTPLIDYVVIGSERTGSRIQNRTKYFI